MLWFVFGFVVFLEIIVFFIVINVVFVFLVNDCLGWVVVFFVLNVGMRFVVICIFGLLLVDYNLMIYLLLYLVFLVCSVVLVFMLVW